MNKLDFTKLETLDASTGGSQEPAQWIQQHPALHRLVCVLFGVSKDASEAELLEAGQRFVADYRKLMNFSEDTTDLEALSAKIEHLAEQMLSETDRKVCRLLGLSASEFIKR